MTVRRPFIFLALTVVLVVSVFAGGRAWCRRIRYDGVYYQQHDDSAPPSASYLRFFPDGHLTSCECMDSPSEAAEFLESGSPSVSRGTYSTRSGSFEASASYDRGTLYWSGEVHCDHLEVQSSHGHGRYEFQKIQFPKKT